MATASVTTVRKDYELVLLEQLAALQRLNPKNRTDFHEKEMGRLSRYLKAVKAGYSPIAINKEWVEGELEDPRPFKGFGGSFIPLVIISSILTSFLSLAVVLIIMAGIFGLGLVILLIDSRALRKKGYENNFLTLKNKIPKWVEVKGLEAESTGIFDKIKVFGPPEAFNRVRGAIDPILAGKIGDACFEIAHFDLGEDLKSS